MLGSPAVRMMGMPSLLHLWQPGSFLCSVLVLPEASTHTGPYLPMVGKSWHLTNKQEMITVVGLQSKAFSQERTAHPSPQHPWPRDQENSKLSFVRS